MIRILHTADWHLGQTFFGYDRTEEHEAFFDWLAGEILPPEIDALIIAGDVFDVSNPSAASQSIYYRFIYRVTAENPNLQIVIVAGNHDSAARLEAPLPLLQAMRTEVRGVVRKLEGGAVDYDHLCVELKNRQGEVILPKGKERLYRAMGPNVMSRDGNPFFNAYSPEIRDESFFNGYNRIIQKVEFNCGLAYGTLSDPQVVDKTAEEIKASKQRSYATVKSIQNSLGNALENLVAAVEVWMSLGSISADGKVEVSCSWDDSLVTDKKYETEQLRADYSLGVVGPVEYRMKRFGETEEQAIIMLQKASQFNLEDTME